MLISRSAARRWARVGATLVISVFLVPTVVAGTALAALLYLPLPAKLPEANPTVGAQQSRIYDINGKQIGVFRQFEQTIPVRKKDIPTILKRAVIVAEDRNFYEHGGVDARGTLRALYADIRNRRAAQGGSTITQQYVKNAYTKGERTISRKVREAILASQLDRQVDKEEILFRYLSSVYLGEGAYGVGAASETYFRKHVSKLTISEAALLAGLIPAPSRYEPRGNVKLAEAKRKIVLRSMRQEGYLTRDDYREALKAKVWLKVKGKPKGPATVVHPPITTKTKYPYFVDYLRRYLVLKYGEDRVFRGGLQIQTTLDPKLQVEAERSVAEGLAGTNAPLEMSLVAVEPPTGFVKALVGGRDFANAQVNLALGGCPSRSRDPQPEVTPTCWHGKSVLGGGTGRQPGSAFKPFVLAAAYEKGIPPSRSYSGAPYVVPNCQGRGCVIQNFGGASYGVLDLKRATQNSVNGVYARLIQDVGHVPTARMARKLGLTSAWFSRDKVHFESGNYSLGVIETSPLDMASAFGVFANGGLRKTATPVVKVVDAKGKVLEDNTKRKGKQVIDEAVADNVTDALRRVIEGGTASRRGQIGRQAAGKTGTTQGSADAWFTGYTPTLSTSVWLGYSNSRQPVSLPGYGLVEGGELPTATWARFMKAALAGVKATKFDQPAPIKAPVDIEQVIRNRSRQGIFPGLRRYPAGSSTGGPYEENSGTPTIGPPPTSSTTTSTSTSTTTTTVPAGPGPP